MRFSFSVGQRTGEYAHRKWWVIRLEMNSCVLALVENLLRNASLPHKRTTAFLVASSDTQNPAHHLSPVMHVCRSPILPVAQRRAITTARSDQMNIRRWRCMYQNSRQHKKPCDRIFLWHVWGGVIRPHGTTVSATMLNDCVNSSRECLSEHRTTTPLTGRRRTEKTICRDQRNVSISAHATKSQEMRNRHVTTVWRESSYYSYEMCRVF